MVEKPLLNSHRENMLTGSEALVELAGQEYAKDVEKQRQKEDMSERKRPDTSYGHHLCTLSRQLRRSLCNVTADLREDGPVWGKVRFKELLSLFIVHYFTYSRVPFL
jgi:hypothetical protein